MSTTGKVKKQKKETITLSNTASSTGKTPAPTSDAIFIKGARVHNLKNIDVAIPRNKLVVVTGVSGSGKSSLTIDTLFAEGQRRYAESLSAYARQFMARMDKPDVDYIKGLCPAIAIEQKVITRTPRSTVGSMTEIYDYLRLLFARVGKTYSPISGRIVKKDDVSDVVNAIAELTAGDRVLLLTPFKQHKNRDAKEELNILLQKGFSRLHAAGETLRIEDLLESGLAHWTWIVVVLVVTAAAGIPIRLYLLAAASFDVRTLTHKFHRLFPFTFVLDELWALAPFLLLPEIGLGLALAASAALIYVPFSQRTVLLMGEANSGGGN